MNFSTRLFSFFSALILAQLIGWLLFPSRVEAASPVITVANWDPYYDCGGTYIDGRADAIVGVADLDSFTRDTLAGEVYSSWPVETIKANAVLIRSGAYYYAGAPQGNDPSICNGIGYPYTLRTTTYQGWNAANGALIGNANNRPNDRVTDTGGDILLRNGGLWFPDFQDCIQNYSRDLGNLGRSYTNILTAADGVYGASRPSWVNCAPTQSNLTVNTNYYTFRNSMTNGTVPGALGTGASFSTASTPVFAERQAEAYWGWSAMNLTWNNPFGQPGRYAVGFHSGDKIEYLMDFGGSYSKLHVIGIADRPQPVTMNIYIDGYFRGQMSLTNNNNARHLVIGTFGGLSYASRAIAIEFANDVAGSGEDNDRNFYLDVIGVTN